VLAQSAELAERTRVMAEMMNLDVAIHVCHASFTDAVATARAAKPEPGLVAVVEGKNGVVSALGAGVDEALESSVLSPELLAMATRLASERVRFRSDREVFVTSLAHKEKLAALGTVVAGVAHEINNPAAAVLLNLDGLAFTIEALREELDALARAPSRAQVNEHVEAIRKLLGEAEVDQVIADSIASVKVIVDVVRDLRIGSRSSDEAPAEVVDMRLLVKQVLRLSALESESLHVELDFPDEIPLLWLPRSRLVQIVTNLISNAAYAMRRHPRPLHRLRVMLRLDETSVMLAIADTGHGMPPEQLERMFEPFFTTKGAEHGTGLGLFMSREIVRKLGGDLTLDSFEGEGTTAMIFLPTDLRTAATAERRMDAMPGLRPRVLVVDEDLERLRTTENSLKTHYDVLIARGGVEALDVLESGSHVDAVLCELHMPAMAGSALYERIAQRWPRLADRMVFFSEEGDLPVSSDPVSRQQLSPTSVERTAVFDALRQVLEPHASLIG
jgi:signal transduction histidine kinase